jgi:hypothetical protein
MDAYDFEKIDNSMSKRVDAIYQDPARHKFYSCFEVFENEGRVGPRGGKIRGNKRTCYHCGGKKKGHAEVTEQL